MTNKTNQHYKLRKTKTAEMLIVLFLVCTMAYMPVSAIPKTPINTNQNASAHIKLWLPGEGITTKNFNMTQAELEKSLIEWGSPKDAARNGAKETFELLGGGDRIVDVISDLTLGQDPFGAFLGAAVLSVAIAFGAAIGAIVNRVRIENGSNVAIYNTIPEAKIEIVKASKEFDAKFLRTDGNVLSKGKINSQINATSTKKNPLSGMVLYMAPDGGRSQLRGVLFLKMTLPNNRVHYFELHLHNRVGAGQKSQYTLVSSDNQDRTGPFNYYRGRGTRPKTVRTGRGRNRTTKKTCSGGTVLEGGLCRTKCKAGYNGRGSTCSRGYRWANPQARGTRNVQPMTVSSTRSTGNVTKNFNSRNQFQVSLRLSHTNNTGNKHKAKDQRKDVITLMFGPSKN